ncbi:UNVERIFIED_CONTAM: hypothetical protein Sradi_7054900 [Sesamum radiatum]|uniref:Uncharacterized protein n=1 Tax=Sesamum radiatum TaxID=300843 RepID=A0AAW2J6Q5_SESRA
MGLLYVFLTDIMFNKYFRDYAEREKGGNTPPGRSPKGTPASSSSKGKRPLSLRPGHPLMVQHKGPGPAHWGLLL